MLTIIHGVKCISCHNTYQLKYTVTNTHMFPVSVKVLPGILVPTVVPGVTVLVCCRKTVREKKTLSALSNYISETDYSQKVKNTGSFDQMFVPKHFFTFSPLNYQETDKSTKKPVLISVTVFHGVS